MRPCAAHLALLLVVVPFLALDLVQRALKHADLRGPGVAVEEVLGEVAAHRRRGAALRQLLGVLREALKVVPLGPRRGHDGPAAVGVVGVEARVRPRLALPAVGRVLRLHRAVHRKAQHDHLAVVLAEGRVGEGVAVLARVLADGVGERRLLVVAHEGVEEVDVVQVAVVVFEEGRRHVDPLERLLVADALALDGTRVVPQDRVVVAHQNDHTRHGGATAEDLHLFVELVVLDGTQAHLGETLPVLERVGAERRNHLRKRAGDAGGWLGFRGGLGLGLWLGLGSGSGLGSGALCGGAWVGRVGLKRGVERRW